jgi:hypothetical protein
MERALKEKCQLVRKYSGELQLEQTGHHVLTVNVRRGGRGYCLSTEVVKGRSFSSFKKMVESHFHVDTCELFYRTACGSNVRNVRVSDYKSWTAFLFTCDVTRFGERRPLELAFTEK